MKTVLKSETTALRHATCSSCERGIVFAPRVGWIEVYPGDGYDNCSESEYGHHVPDPDTDSEPPYWMAASSRRSGSS